MEKNQKENPGVQEMEFLWRVFEGGGGGRGECEERVG